MNRSSERGHAITSLFSLILFGVFLLLLLLLLLSAAEVYQSSVEGTEENYQLRTTMSYLTTKLRQHDSNDQISTGTIAGLPAVCLKDTISEKDYTTYIYLEDGELKELFAASDLQADPMMGTSLTSMDSFETKEIAGDLYQISLTDSSGHSGVLYFHAGAPE